MFDTTNQNDALAAGDIAFILLKNFFNFPIIKHLY